VVRNCNAARLTSPLRIGQTKFTVGMVIGSVWVPWLIDEEGALLWAECGLSEGKVADEGTGTSLGAEELLKRFCTSL